jgi:regulatory protein
MKTRTNRFSGPPLPPFERALKYLSLRARSAKEISDYLRKKEYSEENISDALKRLIELKFINDDNFARGFTENRQRKGKSKKAIEFELKLKGITKDITQDVLHYSQSDYKTAMEYITKRLHQFDRYEPEDRQKKIIGRLRTRGYDWETISKVLRKIQ